MDNQAQARAWIAAEKIRVAMVPPDKLEDVVKPGDLAALVPLARWEPLQEFRQKTEAARAQVAELVGKISEVEETLRGFDAKRPRDAVRAAEDFLQAGAGAEARGPRCGGA